MISNLPSTLSTTLSQRMPTSPIDFSNQILPCSDRPAYSACSARDQYFLREGLCVQVEDGRA